MVYSLSIEDYSVRLRVGRLEQIVVNVEAYGAVD